MNRVGLLCCWCLAACAHGLSAVPGECGPTWYEVTGPHFTVLTDLEREEAVAAVQELEDLLTAYLQVGWQAHGWPERFNVVVFSDREDVQEFKPNAEGFYLTNAMLQGIAVVPAHSGDYTYTVIKHELNHHIAFAAMPQHPRWFAEGIATFFQLRRAIGVLHIAADPTVLSAMARCERGSF